MKISIIVPVYNTEKYLRKCIESLIKQTYKDIEIIFVNDGSTDNSKSIIEYYQLNDSRIRLINQKNQGGIIARKNGILHAKGEYCMLIDSDDWIEENTIECLVKYIRQYKKIDIIKFGYIMEPKKVIINRFIDKDDIFINEYLNNDIFNELLYTSRFNSIWNCIVKKDVFDFNSYIFKRIVHKSEDLLINLQLFTKAKSYLLLSDVYYHYNTMASGITNNHSVDKIILNINDYLYVRSIKEKISKEFSKEYKIDILNQNYLIFIVYEIVGLLTNDNCNKQALEKIQNELINKNVYKFFNKINIGNIKFSKNKFENLFYRIVAYKVVQKKIYKMNIYSKYIRILQKIRRRKYEK